jgi:5'-phosphate synthase pdxT subunit
MTSRPVVGVLALQGDVHEHALALEAAGARAVAVRRRSELDAVDALVVPGGESTTISKLLVAFDLLDPIRDRVRTGTPVYGSCAGMILLAERVLDTRPDHEGIGGIAMTVRRNAFGRQVESFETDLDLPAVGADPVRAVFIRAPWAEEADPEVEVLARIGAHPSAGTAAGRIVAVRQGALVATAFHPEITGDLRVHRYFVEIVRGQS